MSNKETPDDNLPPEIPVADYDDSIIEGEAEKLEPSFLPGSDLSLPSSPNAEEAILNAVLCNNRALDECVAVGLKTEDFFLQVNSSIFRQMQRLREDDRNINLVSLACELARFGKPTAGENHWREKLKLIVALPVVEQVVELAKIVREKSIARQFIYMLNGAMNQSLTDDQPVNQLLGEHAGKIWDLVDQCTIKGPIGLAEALKKSVKLLEERYDNKQPITGIETGFDRFDELTGGLQPTDVIVVSARPGLGKTSWCLNVAAHAAIKNGKKVAIFSLEMNEQQVALRLLSAESRVDSHRIRTGRLGKEDWGQISRALADLSEAQIKIDDSANISIPEIWAKCRNIRQQLGGLDLVMVDYAQLVRPVGEFENRNAAVGSISKGLKALAKGLGIPVLAVSQQKRKPGDRPRNDNRPRLEDLSESGALEADADVVAFLYHENFFNPTDDNLGVAEMIIAKQRNGPTDSFKMAWLAQFTKFENLWAE